MSDRLGDWMLTASGRQYWPLDPRPGDVCMYDIAAALSKLCRFAGHTRRFYSVAEHSVHVSRVVPPEYALQGLMHDSPEAYVVDVPRPLKRGLGALYAEIEQRNWLAICEAVGLPEDLHASVKHADDAVLMAERDALMDLSGPRWSVNVEPANVRIEAWTPEVAEFAFLARYAEITK